MARYALWGLILAKLVGGWGAQWDTGVTLTVLLSFGLLAYHVAAWGIGLPVLAAAIDDLRHRLFGLDVTLWSPPHLLGKDIRG